jgi:AcrR family transcriptional regulator
MPVRKSRQKAPATGTGRSNQRHRTRKDLLQAAARLLKAGRQPTMGELADEARVSRATAYRYFDSVEAVLAEAPVDTAMPDPDTFFADVSLTDPADRVALAEAAIHQVAWANAPQLRAMLAHSVRAPRQPGVPVRQNRRGPLIEAALAPVKKKLDRKTWENLCASLALVFGTEAMIVFQDVLGLDEAKAKRAKEWAVRALVAAALRER